MDKEENVMLEILERLTKIETKIDSYSDAKKKTYENEKEILKLRGEIDVLEKENGTQNKEIAELKEKNKWLFRTTAGAVITGLVGIIIAFVSAGVGI
ncbi:MAG: hemolysin XhlA family protein [Lachnospiraceae bacterium]|nr:hemolysin XhlA family protein [Lachnospiraceae bacterium]